MFFKLKGTINAKGEGWDPKNDGDRSCFQLEQAGRNPKKLTQVFKARKGIGIIGQDGVVHGQVASSNTLDPTPVFVEGFFPHALGSKGTDFGAKIWVCIKNLEVTPARQVFKKPASNLITLGVKVIEPGRYDGAFFSAKLEPSHALRKEESFNNLQETKARQGPANVICAPPKEEV